jgi:hypothetical protein
MDSHQTVRLGPGRHEGPDGEVCVMELASMLAGERFTDRPSSVCPLVGAVVRAYNDALDGRRRKDLYRFASEAVGTRGDFSLQRVRTDLALDYVREHRQPRLAEPDPDAGPEEVADYVLFAMARRPRSRIPRRRFDDRSHAEMLTLLERLIDTRPSPLFGELVEHAPEAIENGRGGEELFIGEFGQGGSEPGFELGAPGLDEGLPPFGQRREDYATVAVGAGAFDEAGMGEPVEHLGHGGWAEIGFVSELGRGHGLAVAQAEEQAVLSVAEERAPALLTTAHPPQSGHGRLEGPAQLLGGLARCAFG